MSKKTPIGFLKCFCDFPDGEIRLDKNENPYFYCPDCSIQVLTHGGPRGAMLKAKMKPVDLAVKKAVEEMQTPPPEKKPKKEKPKKEISTKTPSPEKEKPKEKKQGFGLMGGNS